MRRHPEIAPSIRDRNIRRRLRYWWLASRWIEYAIGVVIVILALVSLSFMAVILGGCTTLTAEQQREMAAQAKGCYCAGRECKEIKSAAGQAAVAAAGERVINITEIRKPEKPSE